MERHNRLIKRNHSPKTASPSGPQALQRRCPADTMECPHCHVALSPAIAIPKAYLHARNSPLALPFVAAEAWQPQRALCQRTMQPLLWPDRVQVCTARAVPHLTQESSKMTTWEAHRKDTGSSASSSASESFALRLRMFRCLPGGITVPWQRRQLRALYQARSLVVSPSSCDS